MPVQFDMGKVRRVSRKTSPTMGPPPEPTAEMRASAARYRGSAKEASDIAAQSKRAKQQQRRRKMGYMSGRRGPDPQMGPPPLPAGGGGGGSALVPTDETEQDWWMNPWVWAGAVAAILLFRRKK